MKDDRDIVTIVHANVWERQPRLYLWLGFVDEQEHAALATNCDIEISVAIQVSYGNLHAAARAAAIVDNMAHPLDLARDGRLLIPVDPERLSFSWIPSVMRHEPFPGNNVQLAVSVQVHQCYSVTL